MFGILAKLLIKPFAPHLVSGVAVFLVVTIIGLWGANKVTVSQLNRRISSLTREIDDPAKGYRVRLSTCDINRQKTEDALKAQSERLTALSLLADRQKQITAKALQRLQDAEQRANRRVTVLSAPLTGSDTCSRLEEADRRWVETHR